MDVETLLDIEADPQRHRPQNHIHTGPHRLLPRPGYSCLILIFAVVIVSIRLLFVHFSYFKSIPDVVVGLESLSTEIESDVSHDDDTSSSFDLVAERDYSKEAYVTLLAPGNPHPWTVGKTDYYFEACKVKAHRLLRNATTRDPFNRPFIVLVTPNVPDKQIEILESHGVQVKRVPTIEPPPGTVDLTRINPRYRDQFTKLHVWNMTEYNRIAYFDADTLTIRPIYEIFDTPTEQNGDETWLFAAVYDSYYSRTNNNRNPPGPEDKGREVDRDLNAGVFLLSPTETQSEYIFDMLRNPPERDFTTFMEQDMLRWAYRDEGPYPWIRLSHLYNTQWCRAEDLDTACVIHDKFWLTAADAELRKVWYQAWGEMIGWDVARHDDGIQHWQEESGMYNLNS